MLYCYWEVIRTETGEFIRVARKAKNLTQKQLGELSGIAEPTIRRYELGKLNPKYETLQRIAKALGVSVLELIPAEVKNLDFEAVCDLLDSANLCVESAGCGDNMGPDGDYYYVWHKDTKNLAEDRVILTFRDLSHIVAAAKRDVEISALLWKRNQICEYLEEELFVPRYHATPWQEGVEAPPEGTDTTAPEKPIEQPSEGE